MGRLSRPRTQQANSILGGVQAAPRVPRVHWCASQRPLPSPLAFWHRPSGPALQQPGAVMQQAVRDMESIRIGSSTSAPFLLHRF